jgi:hypothetical protein
MPVSTTCGTAISANLCDAAFLKEATAQPKACFSSLKSTRQFTYHASNELRHIYDESQHGMIDRKNYSSSDLSMQGEALRAKSWVKEAG